MRSAKPSRLLIVLSRLAWVVAVAGWLGIVLALVTR